MTFMMVNDEQARLIAEASSPVIFVDARGREIGKLQPLSADQLKSPGISEEELAELKRRMASPGPGKTTEEILDRLKAMAPVESP
jgi:hypothetical protein